MTSIKWISKSDRDGLIKINHDAAQTFSMVQNKPCNLITIFGLARQGKSFLMNCLSGNDSTFAVSDSMEPVIITKSFIEYQLNLCFCYEIYNFT